MEKSKSFLSCQFYCIYTAPLLCNKKIYSTLCAPEMLSELESVVASLFRARLEKEAPQLYTTYRVIADGGCAWASHLESTTTVAFRGHTHDEMLESLGKGITFLIEDLNEKKSQCEGTASATTLCIQVRRIENQRNGGIFSLSLQKGIFQDGGELIRRIKEQQAPTVEKLWIESYSNQIDIDQLQINSYTLLKA